LKQELDKTIRLLELSKDREEKSKQRIDHLHGEISNLHAIIDKANQT
jgi:flagellar biosynthesis regulator FlaF